MSPRALIVTVVSGPPCSGKSTYVDERRAANDLVIDLDRIVHALGGLEHEPSDRLFRFACEAVDAILRKLAVVGYPGRIWYVACKPSRTHLALLGGYPEHVKLTADIEVLKARAVAHRPFLWLELINRYFDGEKGTR